MTKTRGQLISMFQHMKTMSNDNAIKHIKHEDIDTTCGYLLEDKQEIERLEKALDKMCRIFDEEIHNCDFLLIRNGLCDSKCTLCDQEKRVELMKEWVMKDEKL